MAGFIPLTSLGQRLLSDLSNEQFGNFKSSLVGLLGAYNYELSILQVQPCDSVLWTLLLVSHVLYHAHDL